MPMLRAPKVHLPIGHIEHGEQGCPFHGVHSRARCPRGNYPLGSTGGALHCSDLALLVYTQHQRVSGQVQDGPGDVTRKVGSFDSVKLRDRCGACWLAARNKRRAIYATYFCDRNLRANLNWLELAKSPEQISIKSKALTGC